MANEVTGKTLKYFQNSIEQAVKSVAFDRNFTMLDTTNSSTAGAGIESAPGRAKSTVKVVTDLLDVLGTEVVTGTLVAGTKYLVTGGTITETQGSFTIGKIFQSDGTGTASAINKVKPLGAKITGKSLTATIGGSSFLVTNLDYSIKYNELDATTSGTASPNSEIVTGRAKVTSKFDCIMYRTTADYILNAAPSAQALVLTFSSGLTVTGTAILSQMSISDEVSGVCKVTYNAEWQGIPTEVGIGYLTMATSQIFQCVWETGTSTNKAITGSLTLVEKTISADVSNDVSISYSGSINGAITPAIYS